MPGGTPFFGRPPNCLSTWRWARRLPPAALDQIADVLEHGRTALLVRPGDPNDLVEAIQRLAADPQLRIELGRNSRETALTRHTWRQNARRSSPIMQTLGSARTSPGFEQARAGPAPSHSTKFARQTFDEIQLFTVSAQLWRVAAGTELRRNVLETYGTRVLVAICDVCHRCGDRARTRSHRSWVLCCGRTIGAIGAPVWQSGLHASNIYYVAKDRGFLPALIGNTLAASLWLASLRPYVNWLCFLAERVTPPAHFCFSRWLRSQSD